LRSIIATGKIVNKLRVHSILSHQDYIEWNITNATIPGRSSDHDKLNNGRYAIGSLIIRGDPFMK
jgi:hypothetical protein